MKEKNLTFFKENGYQVLPGVIPQNVIEEVGNYLESERDKTLETIREDLPFNSIESLIAELGQLYKNKEIPISKK